MSAGNWATPPGSVLDTHSQMDDDSSMLRHRKLEQQRLIQQQRQQQKRQVSSINTFMTFSMLCSFTKLHHF